MRMMFYVVAFGTIDRGNLQDLGTPNKQCLRLVGSARQHFFLFFIFLFLSFFIWLSDKIAPNFMFLSQLELQKMH